MNYIYLLTYSVVAAVPTARYADSKTDTANMVTTAVFASMLVVTGNLQAQIPSSSCARRGLDFQCRLNVPHPLVCYPENSRHSYILDSRGSNSRHCFFFHIFQACIGRILFIKGIFDY